MSHHGIIKQIRNSIASDEYDISSLNDEHSVVSFINGAFLDPFDLTEMIRCTFIVGGGKLTRAKYNEHLPKWICEGLREIGYTEDKGSSCVLSSQATYKQQRDTGKNLLYVHVFPRVVMKVDKGKENVIDNVDALFESSKDYYIASLPLTSFVDKIVPKMPSWTEKERVKESLTKSMSILTQANDRLMKDYAAVLTIKEKLLVDNIVSDTLKDKIELLKEQMKTLIEERQLTREEILYISNEINTKIEKVNEELNKEENGKKLKLLEKLNDLKEKEIKKLEKVESISPIIHKVKYTNEMWKILNDIEMVDKKANQILTIEERKKMPKKDELEKEFAKLKETSKFFFESDEEFEVRFQASKPKKTAAASKVSTVNISRISSGSSSGGGWTTVGVKKANKSSIHSTSGASNKKGASSFAALSIDDDSD